MDKKEIIIKDIILGYNEEKAILAERLSVLGSSNKDISTRGSIENRLKQIDKQLDKFIT